MKIKKSKHYDKLIKINGTQITNTNVNFNKEFLNYTIKEALSVPISNKYKNKYNENHNIVILEKYYNENEIAKQFFDLIIENTINYLNDGNNTFGGLMDTYKEELKKEIKVKKKIKIL